MADDRYLPGDPAEPSVSLLDYSPFVKETCRAMQMILDLIEANRLTEAGLVALGTKFTAESILRDVEVPLPRRVDVSRTRDVGNPATWVFERD